MEGKRILITDESLNRYGFRLLTKGAKVDNYLKNPVLLWDHNEQQLPIGRLDDLRIEGSSITAVPVFDEKDEFALKIKNKWEGGYLFACSVHFKPTGWSDAPDVVLPGQTDMTVTDWELLEVSMVSVPGNQNAVKLSARELGIPTIKQNASPTMDAKKIAVALGLDENADEAAVLAAANRLTAENTKLNAARVDTLVEAGKAAGIVTAENEAAIRKLAAADYESTAAMLKAAPAIAPVTVTPPANGGAPEKTLVGMLSAGDLKSAVKTAASERDAWTFDDWSKNDPAGLSSMRKNDPESYQRLASAKYASA